MMPKLTTKRTPCHPREYQGELGSPSREAEQPKSQSWAAQVKEHWTAQAGQFELEMRFYFFSLSSFLFFLIILLT